MSATLESCSGQLQYRNLRSGANANGRTGGSDATVDVQLPAGFFVPSADIGSLQAAEGEAPVDKLERQLAAVGVRGQRQVDAKLGSTIEDVGIVAQKDIDHIRHHQFFGSLEILVNEVPGMIIGEATALVVNTDQVQRFTARLNGHPLLTQDANPL